MAGHLAKNDYPVTVYNRNHLKAEAWLKHYSGSVAGSLPEAVASADIVLTCVGDDDDVREVYSVIMSKAGTGCIFVDHTTTSAKLAQELSRQAQNTKRAFIDAPVSGGQAGAEQGSLTIMAGGEQKHFDKVRPVLSCYAKSVTLIGAAGYGQTCKMVNQLCVAGILQGLSEALNLAKASGIDATTILNTLQHGAASSWQMVNRTETMMKDEFDFGFAIDWMRKDLGICFEEAKRLGIDLPISKLIDERYAVLQKKGYGRADTSALIKQFD